MNLIDAIPIGNKYKKNRQQLMYETKITDVNQFKKKLTELRKKYIIVFDEGYYLPASKEEYLSFIKKLNGQVSDTVKTIDLAYREMEEKENV